MDARSQAVQTKWGCPNYGAGMELTPEEIRVLGVLIEKEATTPDQYPLSTNALTNACNQKTSRDPVVDYGQRTVADTMLLLRPAGLARTVISGRTEKHRHVLDEAWGLGPAALAVLGVLMLRGAQSPGELRTRTERAYGFENLDAVEAVLHQLASADQPYVRNLGRAPGQSQDRWTHLLGADSGDAPPASAHVPPPTPAPTQATEPAPAPAPSTPVFTSASAPATPPPRANVEALELRISELEQRMSVLEAELGL